MRFPISNASDFIRSFRNIRQVIPDFIVKSLLYERECIVHSVKFSPTTKSLIAFGKYGSMNLNF